MGVRFSRACLSKVDGRPPRAQRASNAPPAYGRSSLVRGVLQIQTASKFVLRSRSGLVRRSEAPGSTAVEVGSHAAWAPQGEVCAHTAALAAEASARLTAASCGHRRRATPRSTGRLADPGERHRARKPQVGTSSAVVPPHPPALMPCYLCATHVPRNVFW